MFWAGFFAVSGFMLVLSADQKVQVLTGFCAASGDASLLVLVLVGRTMKKPKIIV